MQSRSSALVLLVLYKPLALAEQPARLSMARHQSSRLYFRDMPYHCNLGSATVIEGRTLTNRQLPTFHGHHERGARLETMFMVDYAAEIWRL